MMKKSLLFPSDFMRKLDALSIVARRWRRGADVGLRRTPHIGRSIEFAETRSYSPGDDFRRIDWHAFARLDRLFLRLFHAEESLRVSLLLDTSRSMGWGQPSKLDFARRLAGALAYVSLANDDHVLAAGFSDRLHSYLPPKTGKTAVWKIWEFLEQLPSEDTTDLTTALAQMRRYRPRPGLTFLLTDLFSPTGYQAALRSLLGLQQEVVLLQVLAPEELIPDLMGDWRLVDDEDGTSLELTATPEVIQAYRQRLYAFVEEVVSFCHSRSIVFLQLRSDLSIEDAVLRLLRKARVLT